MLTTLVAGCGGNADTAVLETVAPTEAAEILSTTPEAVLLDIRTPEEYGSERIDGATNVDFYAADFGDQIASLDRSATYVVYCRSGNRTGSAMELFSDLGFESVYEVEGGIVNWVNTGLPIS